MGNPLKRIRDKEYSNLSENSNLNGVHNPNSTISKNANKQKITKTVPNRISKSSLFACRIKYRI